MEVFMGGRGGSSGIGAKNSGLDVTKDGQTTRYYFPARMAQITIREVSAVHRSLLL